MSDVRGIASRRILVDGRLIPATIMIDGEVIADVLPGPPSPGVEDLGGLVVMPALVDTHVHVNEPGRTAWEGFASATAAAAAGGVGLIVDMPLNSIPPTTTVDALQVKRAAAERVSTVDVGFWGGVVPGNVENVEPLAAEGVFGFKSFLVPSGVDEFPPSESTTSSPFSPQPLG